MVLKLHLFKEKAFAKEFAVLLFIFISLSGYSQYFNAGQEPSNQRWKMIETIHFQVIFPEGAEQQGRSVADLMDRVYYYASKSLQHSPKKVSIILHTQTVKSNAFVGWAPNRIELYTTPDQSILAQDWMEHLALHEYRHMVQLSKIESEMPKILRILLGEQAAAILAAAYLPFWFIEGDAVCSETGLSYSGRGRSPEFFMKTRSQLVTDKPFSFDKAYLGSYKDNIPNYYEMGYLMTSGARYLFQDVVWDKILTNVAKKPFSLVAFEKELKKVTNHTKKQLYDTVYSYYQNEWKNYNSTLFLSHYKPITNENKIYASYNFGGKLSDTKYFAEKSSLNDINRFVSISSDGKEKTIFTPGYHFDESLSSKDSMVVWVEPMPDLRWEHADISLVRLLNLNTNKLREFKKYTKLFAPKLSPDNSKIILVEADTKYQFHLRVMDCKTGKFIFDFRSSHNDYFITPTWSPDGKTITSVIQRDNKKGIAKVDLETGQMKIILTAKVQEIKNPIDRGEFIYFVGSYTGIDNLFCIHITTGEISQITSSQFGISNPSIHDNELIYSNYTKNGYRLVRASLDSLPKNTVDIKQIQISYPIAENLFKQEGEIVDFTVTDSIDYKIENYSKLTHAINIHSWAPVVIDPYNYTISPGVSVMSQNKLSTTELFAGCKYDLENKEGSYFANLKYLGYIPVIETNIEYGKKSSYYFQIINTKNSSGQIINVDTIRKDFRWSQTDIAVSLYLPLILSKGKYYTKLQPRINYRLSNISSTEISANLFPVGYYQTVEFGLYGYHILRQSQQDLLPNFGIQYNLHYSTSLKGVADFGSAYSSIVILYLPGLSKNHGIMVYNGYQQKQKSTYSFSNRVRLPRGFQSVVNDKLYTYGIDYKFPICYPDFSLGRFVYIKRIKGSIFYDQSFISGAITSANDIQPYNYSLKSSGIELTTDIHLLRFIAPLEVGFRTNYLFENGYNSNFILDMKFTF